MPKYRAHQLYLRAVQLAAALQPALPKGPWYKKAVDAVQAHRDALEAEEAKKWEHARKPILEKLSSDMDKLNGAKKKEDAEYVKVWAISAKYSGSLINFETKVRLRDLASKDRR